METTQKENNKCTLCLSEISCEGKVCESCKSLHIVTNLANKEKHQSEELKIELLRDISDKLSQVISLLAPSPKKYKKHILKD